MNVCLCVPSCPFDNSPEGECLDAPINRSPSDPTCSLSPPSWRRLGGCVLSCVTRARRGSDSLLSTRGAYISLSNITTTLRGRIMSHSTPPQRSGECCTQSGLLKAIGRKMNLILQLYYRQKKKDSFQHAALVHMHPGKVLRELKS